ncbi:hypothetical protein [Pontibacter mangrovi]|uniref:STAS/SEC14 domain-containing protein n=1 Tax=Pontibacter mangrovi TaxID=2589816 RepID=A0A501W2L3_9BACT|nr:hypothetical protein [Pontibacter mangrovi]TPE41047.1 hypothetical protein FJM65_19575 [Pontibacter mangrovi]
MILFENSIVVLAYSPATDIVEIKYPDLHGYLLPEIKHTIRNMVQVIKNYDVKRVLLDSTRTHVSVSDEESREVATFLATELAKTRVERVARLKSASDRVEKLAVANMGVIKLSGSIPFLLENFTTKEEAMAWLTGIPKLETL